MGLSFLVAEGVDRLDVTVRWGDYRYVEDASRDDGRTDDTPDSGESSDGTEGAADGAVVRSEGTASTRWQRRAREETVPVTLAAADDPYQEPVPGSGGLILHVVARPVSATTFAGRIPPGTRSVSLFLVNGRPPAADPARDEAFAFQADLEVRSSVAGRTPSATKFSPAYSASTLNAHPPRGHAFLYPRLSDTAGGGVTGIVE